MLLNSGGTTLKRWMKHLRTFERNKWSKDGNPVGISIRQRFTYIRCVCVLHCVNRVGIVRSKPEGSQFLRVIKFLLYLFLFTFRSFFTLSNVQAHSVLCPSFARLLECFHLEKVFNANNAEPCFLRMECGLLFLLLLVWLWIIKWIWGADIFISETFSRHWRSSCDNGHPISFNDTTVFLFLSGHSFCPHYTRCFLSQEVNLLTSVLFSFVIKGWLDNRRANISLKCYLWNSQ